jgi:hypothetical protein
MKINRKNCRNPVLYHIAYYTLDFFKIGFLKLGSTEDWHSAGLRPGTLVNRSRVSTVP